MLGVSLVGHAQTFIHSYFDPCDKSYKTITADMSAPIIVNYYGQLKQFTFEQLSRGDLEVWMNKVYQEYKNVSPCQGAAISSTTTSTQIQAISLVNNITNITTLDFSSLTSITNNTKLDVVGQTNKTYQVKTIPNESPNITNNNSDNKSSISNSNSNNKETTEQIGNEAETNNPNNNTTDNSNSNSKTTSTSSSNSDKVSNKSGGNNNSNSSSSNSTVSGEKISLKKKTKEVKLDKKSKITKKQSKKAAKSSSKAKSKKPSILVTGDIVGVQSASTGDQDARGTISFTRVKGDGTASLGGSVDYMYNAQIGNISLMRSWISINNKGHKGINVLSNSFTILPGTWSNTLLFVRVNSLNKFTALYGAAGTYGIMYEEPLINTLAIGGFMYKGKLTKSLSGTFILVGVWSPYIKYYTESILKQQPIAIPFINLVYNMTKTFGIGITGGGTYITGADQPLNYQVLLGCKIIL